MTIKTETVISATADTVAICFIVSERLTRKIFSRLKSTAIRQENAQQVYPGTHFFYCLPESEFYTTRRLFKICVWGKRLWRHIEIAVPAGGRVAHIEQPVARGIVLRLLNIHSCADKPVRCNTALDDGL